MSRYFYLTLFISAIISSGCEKTEHAAESVATFVSDFESNYQQLCTARDLELLKHVSTGQDDSLQYYNDKISKILNNSETYDEVISFRKIVRDDILRRKLDIIYHLILRNKIDSQHQIVNLVDSLNAILAELSRISTSNIKNSPVSYFLCGFNEENVSPENRKLLIKLGDGVGRLIRLRNLAAKQLGYNSYHSINELIEYGAAAKSNMIQDQLEEKTDISYRSIINLSGDSLATNIESLCDLLHQRTDMKNEYGYYFNFNRRSRMRLLVNTFKSIGFDIYKLPIYFIDPDSMALSDTAYCFPINCPHDIRVVTNAAGNMASFYSLYHAAATAIYASHLEQSSYLFWMNQTSLRSEIILSLFDDLISTEKWRAENLDLPDDFAFRLQQDIGKFKILDARVRLLMARLEERLYLTDALQAKPVFAALFERIMKCSFYDSYGWYAALSEYINRPFHYQRKLTADLAAAQIWNAVTAGGSDVDSSLLKYTLIQNCFKPGQQYDWHEMLLQITGEELNTDYYFYDSDSEINSGE